ncbi:MAG: NHL repeat-containing protein [Thermoleophilaceae bacterium]
MATTIWKGARAMALLLAAVPVTAPDASAYIGDKGTFGSGAVAIASDPFGHIYTLSSEVQRYDLEGRFQSRFGSAGSGAGTFDNPHDIAVGADGAVYVSDGGHIQKFGADGTVIDNGWGGVDAWGLGSDRDGFIYTSTPTPDGNEIRKYTPDGVLDRRFDSIVRGKLAIDGDGNVFISDTGDRQVWQYDSGGRLVRKMGSREVGSVGGQFAEGHGPGGVTVAEDGTVWVADELNYRIQQFGAQGEFLAICGGTLDPEAVQMLPRDIATGSNGDLYVSGPNIQRIGETSSPAAPCDSLPPQISDFRVSPKRFFAARHVSGVRAEFQFGVNEPARVSMVIDRARPGRRVGGRCVRVTRQNADRQRCKRWRRRGPNGSADYPAGSATGPFSGWLNGEKLQEGLYRAVARGVDRFGNRSRRASARFRIR